MATLAPRIGFVHVSGLANDFVSAPLSNAGLSRNVLSRKNELRCAMQAGLATLKILARLSQYDWVPASGEGEVLRALSGSQTNIRDKAKSAPMIFGTVCGLTDWCSSKSADERVQHTSRILNS